MTPQYLKFICAAIVALAFGCAHAQNSQCRTAPVGSSTPNCASEAFVSRTVPAPSALPTAIGQLPGVSDGSDADAGNVGEEKDTGPVTITYSASGSPKNITSLLLSAGDWDIQAATFQSGSGATTTTDSYSCLTATSTPTISSGCLPFVMHNRYPAAIDEMVVQTTPSVRVSLAAPATYYLHGEVVISSGSIYGATGYIRARRLR